MKTIATHFLIFLFYYDTVGPQVTAPLGNGGAHNSGIFIFIVLKYLMQFLKLFMIGFR